MRLRFSFTNFNSLDTTLMPVSNNPTMKAIVRPTFVLKVSYVGYYKWNNRLLDIGKQFQFEFKRFKVVSEINNS